MKNKQGFRVCVEIKQTSSICTMNGGWRTMQAVNNIATTMYFNLRGVGDEFPLQLDAQRFELPHIGVVA